MVSRILRTIVHVFKLTARSTILIGANTDDLYNDYEPNLNSPPQRQQQISTPPSQRHYSPSLHSSTKSLRRTPRLQIRVKNATPAPPNLREEAEQSPINEPRIAREYNPEDISFGKTGSTTPQSFRRLIEEDTYWPQRSTYISRRTHEAILFALEAIRRGGGEDAKPLTADLLEENARMSDLLGGNQPSGTAPSTRGQNGSTRVAQGSGPTPAEPPRYNTPTQVLERRKRRQEEARRLREGEQGTQESVAGVDRPLPGRTSQPTSQSQNTGQGMRDPTTTQEGSSIRPPGNVPVTSQPSTRPQPGTTAYVPAGRLSDNTVRTRTETYDTLSGIPATARPAAQSNPSRNPPRNPAQSSIPPPQQRPAPAPQQQPQQPPPPQSQPSQSNPQPQQSRAAFPHAFERWESLSSQWEGITSFWIRRLQENTNELSTRPIDQQMARQITDLSAAGANLFHAVVELQRLRASSERKFQRWFFETRDEQEHSQERFAELERELQQERQLRLQNTSSADAVRTEQSRADELANEMRRELQISKEEARRAWEELGRREQEERERTIALRAGEPTVIGGVQVVPMQGVPPSRQVSTAQRPTTAHGPYPGGPGPGMMGGQQPSTQRSTSRNTTTTTLDSPGEEQHHFTYRPDSPGDTEAATESSRANESHHLRHEPDTQFFASGGRPLPTGGNTAASTSRNPATVASPPQQYTPQTTTGNERYYQPTGASASSLQPPRGDGRSYAHSASGEGSSVGEDEYHINPDGSYTRDAQGRRIPYDVPIGGSEGAELSEEDEDDDYVTEEQAYSQSYRVTNRPQQAPQQQAGNVPTDGSGTGRISAYSQTTVPGPASSNTQQQQQYAQPQTQSAGSGNRSTGSATGQRGREYHEPSRLSDILEESTARTDPSRSSYLSGGGNNPAVTSSAAYQPMSPPTTATGASGGTGNPYTTSGNVRGVPVSAPSAGSTTARR